MNSSQTEKSRPRPSLLALVGGLSLLVAAPLGCGNDETDDDEDTGVMVDGGGDTSADTGQPDTGMPEDTSTTPDSGQDTGPAGSEKIVQSFSVLPPMPKGCSATGKAYRLPFYFVSKERQKPIVEGDIVDGQVMEANKTIGANTLSVRRGRVSEATAKTCTSSADCQAPLKCGESGVRGAERYCSRQTGIEFIPGTARSDFNPGLSEDDKQLVTLLIEDTVSLEGKLPQPVNVQYDENGNDDFGKKEARATDPELRIRKAASDFALSLATANSGDNTKAGLWFFGGERRINAQPKLEAQERYDHFTSDLGLIKDLAADLGGTADEPANPYQAILQVIERDLGRPKYENHEKFLVMLTDGPNEVYDKSATKTKVLSKLQEHNVHLFIIHLDPTIDASLLRDLPSYYQGKIACRMDDSCDGPPPCSSDADCQNHETCRKAKMYADDKPSNGGEVTMTDEKYCMPHYGDDGRLGPVNAYAEMACETGGNYMYVNEPDHMISYADRIPNTFNGQWSVEMDVSALDERVGLPVGHYRLSGSFFGLLSPNLISKMSATGPHTTHTPDSRGLLRVAPDN
jgi:hypothetical protein